jgi:predicted ATPase
MALRIERVRIQGFRSLHDTTFEPGRFSVLIGPNGAGKSNIADAVGFLAAIYRDGLDRALQDRGGFPEVVFRHAPDDERRMAFSIEATLLVGDIHDRFPASKMVAGVEAAVAAVRSHHIKVRHEFSIVPRQDGMSGDYEIEHEDVRFGPSEGDGDIVYLWGTRSSSPVSFEYSIDSKPPEGVWQILLWSIVSDGNEVTKVHHGEVYFAPEDLAIGRFRSFSPAVEAYATLMSNIRAYAIDPQAAQEPGIPSPRAEMGTSGANLPTLIRYLQSQDEAWTGVMEAFYGVVPGWGEIEVRERRDGKLELWFEEPGVGRPWTAEEVSDGTIRALGLLAALYDPRTPLVVIEEPENFLHPWPLRTFVDACRAVTSAPDGKQVVLTTHSPVLLDYVRPEVVQVVWRRNGETQISPLTEREPDAVAMWEEGITSVSGLIDDGSILEAVPVGTG